MPISRDRRCDRKRDDRIEADARQHQTEAAEPGEQRGDPLRRRLRVLQLLRHRLRRDHRQRGVHGAQLALHRPDKGCRVARRPRDDGRRRQARLRVRAVEQVRHRIEDVVVEVSGARVADDADDLRPGARVGPIRKRRPTAFTVPKYCRAIVSVITATRGVSARSRASKTRAVQQRDAKRLEETRPGPDHPPRRGDRVFRRPPVDDDRHGALDRHRHAARQRRGLHAGNGGDPPQELVVEVRCPARPGSRQSARRSRASPRRRRQTRRAALGPPRAAAGRRSCRRAAAPRPPPARRSARSSDDSRR